MDESPADRCGYTWPDDAESRGRSANENPTRQSCCYRETAPSSDQCVWHADPENGDERTVETLRNARPPPEQREQHSPYRELLDGANLSGLELGAGLSFEGTALRHADFSHATLQNADFTGADLRHADFTGTDLREATFTGADLRGATLARGTLGQADLTDATLRRADLTGADLQRATLTRVSLWDADLSRASLRDADLTSGNLRGATLSDAVLFRATLTDAVLFRAVLLDADLREADLSGANLRGTALSKADLRQTGLMGVTVSQTTECGRQTRAQADARSASDWDEIAQAYHELVSTFSDHGLVGKARAHYLLEREARGEEARADGDRWGYLGSLASRYLTGYGVDYRRVLVVMGLVFGLSTLWYWIVELETNVLYFSVVTFTTAPPTIPADSPTQAVAMVETFVGTLLVVLLGYVLGNREQF